MANIVISYSRVDQPLVRGLVNFLRAGLQGIERAVFWDEDFEPGEDWFEQFKNQIRDAAKVFVFWCSHSARSAQVKRELRVSFKHHKQVVPVMLADTRLTERLGAIHAVDLREVVQLALKAKHPRPWEGGETEILPGDPDHEILLDSVRMAFSDVSNTKVHPGVIGLIPFGVLARFGFVLQDDGVTVRGELTQSE